MSARKEELVQDVITIIISVSCCMLYMHAPMSMSTANKIHQQGQCADGCSAAADDTLSAHDSCVPLGSHASSSFQAGFLQESPLRLYTADGKAPNEEQPDIATETLRDGAMTAQSNAQDYRGIQGRSAGPDAAPCTFPAEECVVCWEAEAGVIFQHCGHLCSCHDCALVIFGEGIPCPLCRADVADIITISI